MKKIKLSILVVLGVLIIGYFGLSFSMLAKQDECTVSGGVWSSKELACESLKLNSELSAEPQLKEEYVSKTGKVFKIENTHPVGASLSTVKITPPNDFKDSNPIVLEDVDSLENIFLTDLNNDGFDEIYLTTRSAGSGSSATLYAFNSNKDLSLSAISISAVENFQGRMGHEKYYAENGAMIEEFPIFKEGDTNANPTGGVAKISYSLKPTESGLVLTPR